jgi:hypothetical protein
MNNPFRLSGLITFFGLSDPIHGRGYLGPETLMPLWSILAAILGFFLVFWRLIVKYVKLAIRKMRGLPDEVIPDEAEDPSEDTPKEE